MKTTGIVRAILLCLLLMMVSGLPGIAQEINLLENPGFEGNFTSRSGDQPRMVAAGWEPWHVERSSGMPSFQNTQPLYVSASDASSDGIFPRVRTGNDAQIYYSFFETHDGGIYQQVSGISPGTELRFSIYAYVWSSTFEDFNLSEDPGDVSLRVGIDPTGGTDPLADSVEYSEAAFFYDAFRQYALIATAESDTVTVFVRSTVGEPVFNSYIYLDDAVLAQTTDSSQPAETEEPTATDTPTSTATETPTATLTETEEPTATDTPTSTPTATPTETPPDDDPGESGSDDPTPTQEDAEPPTATPTATPTEDTGLIPTATDIGTGDNGDDATATDAPAVGGPDDNEESAPPITETFPGTVLHTVRPGDTVGRLAVLYGSSTEAIIEANDLNENALIRTGQGLVIPVRLMPVTETPSPTPVVIVVTATPGDGGIIGGGTGGGTGGAVGGPTTGTTYVVQPGDTLSAIAARFNTTVGTLAQINGIANINRVFVGQRLTIPSNNPPSTGESTGGSAGSGATTPDDPGIIPPPVPQSYVVQPGDNLYRIALRFNVSLARLADINGIVNYNRIFVGQRLTLPQ